MSMNKVYNTQEDLTSGFLNFFKKVVPNMRKTVLNILPFIIFASIRSESLVASDIAKHLKNQFSLVQINSVIKRIRRFFNNKLFDPYSFYDSVIRFVISNYTLKHSDKRVHIIFDHMFSHDNYTVFMISMRVGKQGIPLWFRTFAGKCSDAFEESLLCEGISYVSSLFPSDYDLIFLADRWFNSISLMKHIDYLGHTFCIRIKRNVKLLIFDKKEKHHIWKWFDDLFAYKYHASYLNNIPITEEMFPVNIAISKRDGTSDYWLIVTNGDPKRAIKDYGYRFGAIESIFKNQKSNGFYLESTVNASLKYFSTVYTIACFNILYLTILGAEYSKNSKCYKNVKLSTHKIANGTKIRVLSLFNTGLTLFNLAFHSLKYIRVPFRFILYDI